MRHIRTHKATTAEKIFAKDARDIIGFYFFFLNEEKNIYGL